MAAEEEQQAAAVVSMSVAAVAASPHQVERRVRVFASNRRQSHRCQLRPACVSRSSQLKSALSLCVFAPL